MSDQAPCPQCGSENLYHDGSLWICPECAFEATSLPDAAGADNTGAVAQEIRDAHGNVLNEGDTVTVIKDLKVKGASGSIKVGTKVKSIRLIFDADDGHNIACKVDGFGAMNLKSVFVKKA